MRILIMVAWGLCLVSSLLGFVTFLDAVSADSAPKQAAGAALAVASAAVPYVIARALEGLRRRE